MQVHTPKRKLGSLTTWKTVNTYLIQQCSLHELQEKQASFTTFEIW